MTLAHIGHDGQHCKCQECCVAARATARELLAENADLRDQLAAARVSLEAMVENARRVQDQRDALKAALADTEENVRHYYDASGHWPNSDGLSMFEVEHWLRDARRRAGLEL